MKLLDQKGQALVEMALLLPLLLLIVFGITEFGRALFIENSLVNAARAAARMASIRTTSVPANDAALITYVKKMLPDLSGLEVTNTAASEHGVDTVTVDVKLKFQSAVPLIDQLNNIDLKGRASMLYE